MSEIRILHVEDNSLDAELVQEYLKDLESPSCSVRWADSLYQALDALVEERFDLVLLDLFLPDCQEQEGFQAIQRRAPGTPIVIMSGLEDEEFALAAVRAGADDYVVKGSMTPESLTKTIRYAVLRARRQPEAASQPGAPGRMIALFGAKGGVGTSTVACHVAHYLRKHTQQEVLLVKTAAQGNSPSFLLQAAPRFTLKDAADKAHLLDEPTWVQMVTTTRFGVDLLPASDALQGYAPPPVARVKHVLEFARRRYPWVLLDCGRADTASVELLEPADTVLMVTTPDLMSLYRAREAMQWLRAHGLEERARIVLNRAEDASQPSRARLVREGLGKELWRAVEDRAKDLEEAVTRGKLLEEGTPAGRNLKAIAAALAGSEPTGDNSGPIWERLSMNLTRSVQKAVLR
ncbi:MAG: response regulator [Bryobacter sp.]|nr:response regulator [Bryobacter sp.]